MVSAGNYELLDLQGNPIGSIQGGADVNATVTERWIRIAGEGGGDDPKESENTKNE